MGSRSTSRFARASCEKQAQAGCQRPSQAPQACRLTPTDLAPLSGAEFRICRARQSRIKSRFSQRPNQEHNLNLVRAIYPGSFDPLTNGHLDLIERGSKIFDELIVGILRNAEKDPLFSLEERREMLEQMVRPYDNVRVDTFEGLLVDYAMQQKAKAVLRGIRAISDYEYELQMALMNRKLQPQLETVFMMPAETYSYLSSRLVKEVFRLGGSVRGLVPEMVEQRMRDKFHGTAAAI
jgi:pantetheine-phosphate adenylyltransferase